MALKAHIRPGGPEDLETARADFILTSLKTVNQFEEGSQDLRKYWGLRPYFLLGPYEVTKGLIRPLRAL